jgi:glycosyltransferase involved in cell wall biosynthesis
LTIIIIDDGSFPEIIIKNPKIIILRNKKNQGKGYSLLKGFKYAQENDFTHAVTLDADSQHDPRLITMFLEVNEDISLVLGTRRFDKDMPYHRRISNKLTSLIISFLSGNAIQDSQCGYRRYKLNDICSEIFIETGFQFESEILIKLLRKKCSYYQIDIPTIYGNEKSSMNNIIDTLKFIRLILRSIIKY